MVVYPGSSVVWIFVGNQRIMLPDWCRAFLAHSAVLELCTSGTLCWSLCLSLPSRRGKVPGTCA